MTNDHHPLPQLAGGLFLTDAGVETDLIFNHGIEIPEFAAHTLLATEQGRGALESYIRGFLELAAREQCGFILDSHTWKAHPHWAEDLGATEEDLRAANLACAAFVSGLRDEYAGRTGPLVLSGTVGPRGDAYRPEDRVPVREAAAYHSRQLDWLAEAGVDMVTALTFTLCPGARRSVTRSIAWTTRPPARQPTSWSTAHIRIISSACWKTRAGRAGFAACVATRRGSAMRSWTPATLSMTVTRRNSPFNMRSCFEPCHG